MQLDKSIAAISTPPGTGGIAVVRLSGKDAFAIADRVWQGRKLSECQSHTLHLGDIIDRDGSVLDTCVAALYKAPNSYTGEDTVEFSIHGSPWIQREVVSRLIDAGASAAEPGEFTQRAFVNGKLDLAQAEGVADMIASSSRAAQRMAARQMKGDFSRRLSELNARLVELGALLELELDFSEEDVEFADREQLRHLADTLLKEVDRLSGSFRAGQALKAGVNVVIAGIPNAGKSTLLNKLLGDERAIVSDISGTTRDFIEDTIEIEGILFRITDTAGLHETDDAVEQLGIERTRMRISKADILLQLIDATEDVDKQIEYLNSEIGDTDASQITIINKIDLKADVKSDRIISKTKTNLIDKNDDTESSIIWISAKEDSGLERVKMALVKIASRGCDVNSEIIVTNARHYESLKEASGALQRFVASLTEGMPADILAQDLREATHHLNAITGTITTDTLLHTIFSRFCIGK